MNQPEFKTYTDPTPLFSFATAIRALEKGGMCSRMRWPIGTFIFRQVPSDVPFEFIPKMTSLPVVVKKRFLDRNLPISYSNQLAICNAQNDIVAYTITASDCLAHDWVIVEGEETETEPKTAGETIGIATPTE